MEDITSVQLPKVAIRFCVQCKWNLRAAYYAQELLQTFSNSLGEVSLIPVTGGIFTIDLYHSSKETPSSKADSPQIVHTLIWDRKRDSGFPETKELKNRVRNIIDPTRDMGHVDRALKKTQNGQESSNQPSKAPKTTNETEQASEAVAKTTDTSQEVKKSSPDDCEECATVAGDVQPK